MPLEPGEFSVVQYFSEGSVEEGTGYEYVRRHVSAKEAMKAFKHYTHNVAARLGMVERVIVTDGGDCVNFEWQYGKGITFPDAAELAKHAGGEDA